MRGSRRKEEFAEGGSIEVPPFAGGKRERTRRDSDPVDIHSGKERGRGGGRRDGRKAKGKKKKGGRGVVEVLGRISSPPRKRRCDEERERKKKQNSETEDG